MATKKKIDIVKKSKAEKPTKVVEVKNEPVSDIEMAIRLGAVFTRTGSHLTVKSYPDGQQELIWDDAALEREVREAIASVENK